MLRRSPACTLSRALALSLVAVTTLACGTHDRRPSTQSVAVAEHPVPATRLLVATRNNWELWLYADGSGWVRALGEPSSATQLAPGSFDFDATHSWLKDHSVIDGNSELPASYSTWQAQELIRPRRYLYNSAHVAKLFQDAVLKTGDPWLMNVLNQYSPISYRTGELPPREVGIR